MTLPKDDRLATSTPPIGAYVVHTTWSVRVSSYVPPVPVLQSYVPQRMGDFRPVGRVSPEGVGILFESLYVHHVKFPLTRDFVPTMARWPWPDLLRWAGGGWRAIVLPGPSHQGPLQAPETPLGHDECPAQGFRTGSDSGCGATRGGDSARPPACWPKWAWSAGRAVWAVAWNLAVDAACAGRRS